MPSKDKYTDPKLRDEIKEELKESDKGGAPGQWSARKAQMMAQEYKKRGGGYNTDKSQKDEDQKNLTKWTEEEWQTKEGSGHAKKEDGTEKRYLPKKAWEKMSEEEKKETDKKKQEGSKKGQQYIDNTKKAKNSRKEATEEHDSNDDEIDGENKKSNGKSQNGNDEKRDSNAGEDDDENGENRRTTRSGQKRKSQQQTDQSSKKQKSSNSNKSGGNAPEGRIGSKHMPDEEPGLCGSNERLPKKGQSITWRAMPGYVEGKVVEVLKKGKKVDGKHVKASENDPKIIMKSNSSGKICVHKPDACYYD